MGTRLTSLQYEICRLDRELETIEPDEEKTLSQKEEKDEKKMEKVEEEIVSKEEAEKMKELRRRVQDLAEDNEYVQSNLSDQAMVRKRSYANSQHTLSQNIYLYSGDNLLQRVGI